jgi:hypothetical protein
MLKQAVGIITYVLKVLKPTATAFFKWIEENKIKLVLLYTYDD